MINISDSQNPVRNAPIIKVIRLLFKMFDISLTVREEIRTNQLCGTRVSASDCMSEEHEFDSHQSHVGFFQQ